MSNPLGNILNSHKFTFYSKLAGACISGGTFMFFLMKNQIEFYKDQNASMQTQFALSEKLSEKQCDDEKAQIKLSIQRTMNEQYRKFGKESQESRLFLETMALIEEKGSK